MKLESNAVYLPLRGFGDYLITVSAVKDCFTDKIPIILPVYLTDIFNATNSERYFDVISRPDYRDMAAFFELKYINNIKNIKRLLNDTKRLYSILNRKQTFLLDYHSKRISFFNAKLQWPDVTENIYEGKFNLFSRYFDVKDKLADKNISPLINDKSRIVIIPGSRFQEKRINGELVKKIINSFSDREISVAEFGSSIDHSQKNTIYYNSFSQLIDLISKNDLIISAESLPYHFAYFLNKPHFVIYNKSKHFIETFKTPFMIRNDFQITHDKGNDDEIIERLSQVIKAYKCE